ncbi:chromo domain-containing protein [Sporothrix brasiliensis 5110]|uniref:Chromo domain-containing protein n=1 Tax=Sporothrix brasiliensis 5110 TaxID=1398154 RepID=A0A0C2JBD6_9PEZI|nr:chromo domain-containing protein [Sporothrix brasiliensis 5110]KIH94172.1 chromo domain-containing protein [Sporothrix brasiliensis 5110]
MSGFGDDDDPFALFSGRNGGDGTLADDHLPVAGDGIDGTFAMDADNFFETNVPTIDPATLWGDAFDFNSEDAGVEGAGGGDEDATGPSENANEEHGDGEDGNNYEGDGEEEGENHGDSAASQEQFDPPPIPPPEIGANDAKEADSDAEDDAAESSGDENDDDVTAEADSSDGDERVIDDVFGNSVDSQDIPPATVEKGDDDTGDLANEDSPLPVVASDIAPRQVELSDVPGDVFPSTEGAYENSHTKDVKDADDQQHPILMSDQFANHIDDSMLDRRRNLDDDDEYQDENDEDEDENENENEDDVDEQDGSTGEVNNDHTNDNGTGEHAIDADLIMPGDGSRLEVVVEPLPESRHAEYEVCAPSDYVYRVIARVRGRSRYEIEYDDGRRFEFYEKDIYDLPNGSKALHKFKRKELEDVDELSSAESGFKRRRLMSDLNDMSFNASRGVSLGSHCGFPIDDDEDDDMMDLDMEEDSIESHNFLNMQRRRLRLLGDTGRTGIRYSSRLVTAANDDHSDEAGDGRRLRTRAFNSETRTPVQDDEADELGGDDDADFIPTIQSDLQPPRKRGRGRRRQIISDKDKIRSTRDGSIEFERARRSSRATKNTRSMVDPTNYDDESFLVDDDRVPAQPKIINVKEVFVPLDGHSAFKDAHMQICNSCGGPSNTPNKGIMIYCQGCSLAFHKQCIGLRRTREHAVTKVAPDSFVLQCRFCIGQAKVKDANSPRHDTCQVCSKTGPACAPFSQKLSAKQEEKLRLENDGVDPITPVAQNLVNNAENVLFRCTECRRGFHYEHLPPPSASWTDADDANIRKERLEEYLIDGKCRECLDMTNKIEGLIAWRPIQRDGDQTGLDYNNVKEDDKEYLIKWESKSHDHCEWRPGAWVWGACHSRMRQTFSRKNGEAGVPPIFEAKDAIPEEYLLSDIILMVRYNRNGPSTSKEDGLARICDVEQVLVKFQGLGYDAAVWDEPPPPDSGRRWTTFVSAYDEYLNGKHFKNDSQYAMRQRVKDFTASKKFEVISQQPAVLRRGKLMPYQMEGLNWLLLNYYKGKSVVLADEMGLGKTVQVIALLATLILETPRCWPFLVVVPNSTCGNWRREIKNWAPDLRVVSYHGGRVSQSMAYKYELFPDGTQTMHAHVVIMSYDSAQDDNTRRLFHKTHWAGLIVDEGQRLKNDQNLLYLALRAMRIGFRLLLTGTPLQNNKRELFNLLQFIDSANNATELDKTYGTITAENLPELHKLIRPYFLRRTKAEVLKFLPPMAQIIVPVSMTVVQEKLCKSIMAKNPELIRSIFSKGQVKATERGCLNNILMQLRKCLCHPFVYSQAIEDKNVDAEQMHRNLIEASAKLLLLKIMLPKLKERGHRVLIFSQFLNQLDIIEDFLHISGLPYMRLDGTLSSLDKQKRIDAFNAPNSELFAFLLSTRAGGVGINLATADTVIVLDPDFNPHQDIQAFSRAHRIGQKKKVLCFQFMTKDSVEEKIMQIGRSKMALDHALIETMDAEDDAGNDLESILRHGAKALFSEEATQNRIVYDDASVDKLLDRSQVENTRTDDEQTAESQFSFARVWANETGTLADDIELTTSTGDAGEATNAAALSVWDKIISEREAEAARLAEMQREVLGRGGRRRNKIKYTQPRYNEDGDEVALRNDHGDGSEDDRDGEFSGNDNASSSDDEDGSGAGSSRRRSRGQSMAANLTATEAVAEIQGTQKKNARSTKSASPKVVATPKKQIPKKHAPKNSTPSRASPQKAITAKTKKPATKVAGIPPPSQKMKTTPSTKAQPAKKMERGTKGNQESPTGDKTGRKKATQAQLVATTGKSGPKLDPKDAHKDTVKSATAKVPRPKSPPSGEPAAKRPRTSDPASSQHTASSKANDTATVNSTANTEAQKLQKADPTGVQWSQATMGPMGAKITGPAPFQVHTQQQAPGSQWNGYPGGAQSTPYTNGSFTATTGYPPVSGSAFTLGSHSALPPNPANGAAPAPAKPDHPALVPGFFHNKKLQDQQLLQLLQLQQIQNLQVQQHHLMRQGLQQQQQQQQQQRQAINFPTISNANGFAPLPATGTSQQQQQYAASTDASAADKTIAHGPDDLNIPYHVRNRDSLTFNRRKKWWRDKEDQIRKQLEALDKQGPHLAATAAYGATITPSDWAKTPSQNKLLHLYKKRKNKLSQVAVLEEVYRQQQRSLLLKKEKHTVALLEFIERNNGSTTGAPTLKEVDTEDMRRERYAQQNKIPRTILALQNIDRKIVQHLINGGPSVAYDALPEWLRTDLQSIPTIESGRPPESLEAYLTEIYEKNPNAETAVAAFTCSSACTSFSTSTSTIPDPIRGTIIAATAGDTTTDNISFCDASSSTDIYSATNKNPHA